MDRSNVSTAVALADVLLKRDQPEDALRILQKATIKSQNPDSRIENELKKVQSALNVDHQESESFVDP